MISQKILSYSKRMSSSKIKQRIIGEINGKPFSANISAEVAQLTAGHFFVTTEGGVTEIFLTPSGVLSDGNMLGEIDCTIESERDRIIRERFSELGTKSSRDAKKGMVLKAPMPGMVKSISVTEGDKVDKQTQVLVLEAMKMENSISAGFAGIISKIHVTAGTSVEKNMTMMEFVSK